MAVFQIDDPGPLHLWDSAVPVAQFRICDHSKTRTCHGGGAKLTNQHLTLTLQKEWITWDKGMAVRERITIDILIF